MITKFANGITVKELKKIIANWPDVRADGTPTEVWLGDSDGCSNRVIEISTLDEDCDGRADILISHGA